MIRLAAPTLCLLASAFHTPLPAPLSPTRLHLFGKDAAKPGAPGGVGALGGMMEQFKKAQEIAAKTKQMQEELKEARVEATAMDGKVKVVLTGQQQPLEVEIAPDAMGDAEALSSALTEALQTAHERSQKSMTEKLTTLYAGLGMGAPPAA